MRYLPRSTSYSLVVHDDAKADLDELYEKDIDAAASIEVFLDEVKHNQYLLDSLSVTGFVCYEPEVWDTDEWIELKKQKLNIRRIKFLYLEGVSKYRIIYAFDPTQMRYYVLGIVLRSIDYDVSHPTSKRIIATYEKLGIPYY